MKRTRKTKKAPSAESIARMADRGEDVSRFFTKRGKMMQPIQRVNVDFTASMLQELDQAASDLNFSRQAVIKAFIRHALDQHHLGATGTQSGLARSWKAGLFARAGGKLVLVNPKPPESECSTGEGCSAFPFRAAQKRLDKRPEYGTSIVIVLVLKLTLRRAAEKDVRDQTVCPKEGPKVSGKDWARCHMAIEPRGPLPVSTAAFFGPRR